jgi:ubiquitin-small subunit ribosomal protein S27Ae
MGKDDKKKAGKEKAGKRTSKKWKAYEANGDEAKRLRKSCPKCGEGVFLAKHHDRSSCGKCGYTEFSKKNGETEKPKE